MTEKLIWIGSQVYSREILRRGRIRTISESTDSEDHRIDGGNWGVNGGEAHCGVVEKESERENTSHVE